MEQSIEALRDLVASSKNIVFFGGAGVSTESGIPDFRSEDGLYNQAYEHPPEVMLSHSFFKSNTEDFYNFYKDKMLNTSVRPNKAHIALAKLESDGKLKAVITQNIDGLHQMAGSTNVLELHGSVYSNYCMDCEKSYEIDFIINADIPICECGGIIKPDVVLYEEALNQNILIKAVKYISQADVLIVGGTSLSVYPAAQLITYYEGNSLVLINKSETPYDERADLIIRSSIGSVLGEITKNT